MRGWGSIGLALLSMVPGLVVARGDIHLPDPVRALLFGIAIVGAAFLLSWAAEAVQLDFSRGLALALLALIAILPEYVVDATFAWLAAKDPAYASYAVANMTGANRLLIGVAWPLVVAVAFLRFRRWNVELEVGHGLELAVLLAASFYALLLPFKGTLTLVDMVVLLGLFGFYMWRIAGVATEQPHLVGPARVIGALPTLQRRLWTAALALGAAATVILVAEPFAEALVATGSEFGIDEFLLVQWLAPLASEAPEFVVVALFAWRGDSTPALQTLLSSKINQWTVLVALLPLVYSLSLGQPGSLPLDARQREEVLLTVAQSVFAVVLLLDLRLSPIGASMLLGLFLVQMVFPEIRLEVTIAYGVLTVAVLILSHRAIWRIFGGSRSRR